MRPTVFLGITTLRRIKIITLLLGLICISFIQGTRANEDTMANFSKAPIDSKGLFTNVKGELSQGGLNVRVPFLLRRFGTYFRSSDGAPTLSKNDGAILRANAADELTITVTWVGHATVLVQMHGVTFLTDPIWSNWPSPMPYIGPRRFVEPGIEIDNLPAIDFVVVSHNHYDHLDLPTLKKLAARDANTQFFVPLGNARLLNSQGINNVSEMDWGDTATYKNLTIHCLPTQHWSKRSISDTRKSLWASWAVTGPKKRFYFAGDTGYFPGFKEIGEKLGPFDVAAMPIGAYEPTAMMKASHMDPKEAVMASLDIKADNVLAIHFGTFDLSDEPLAEPPVLFKEAAASTTLGEEKTWVFEIGETREF